MSHELILVHGALGSRSQLSPLGQAVGIARVHSIELEGHGDTPLKGPFSIDTFAANIGDFITTKGIERPTIFGYSMGGYAALKLAADSPALVGSVITLATKIAWTPDVAAKEAQRCDPEKIRLKVPAFAAELEERHRGAGGWEQVLANTAAMMKQLGEKPPLDKKVFAGIKQRVRLMLGDRDNLVTYDETDDAARNIERGELVVLPDTPHPFEQVRVELIAAMVRDFLHG